MSFRRLFAPKIVVPTRAKVQDGFQLPPQNMLTNHLIFNLALNVFYTVLSKALFC